MHKLITAIWLFVTCIFIKTTVKHKIAFIAMLENTVTTAIFAWVVSHITFTARCPAVTACSSSVVVGALKDFPISKANKIHIET